MNPHSRLFLRIPPGHFRPPAPNSLNHKGDEVTQRKNDRSKFAWAAMIFAAEDISPASAFPAYLCALCDLCGERFWLRLRRAVAPWCAFAFRRRIVDYQGAITATPSI